VVTLFSGGYARADMVGFMPIECPSGTPEFCHGGVFCRPAACVHDGDCSGGQVCRKVTACFSTGGCRGQGDPSMRETIEGACRNNGICDGDGRCETRTLCVTPAGRTIPGDAADPAPTPSPGESTVGAPAAGGSNAGCASCRAGNDAGDAAMLAMLAPLSGRRRRRR
jgi:hypothetical protein